MAGGNYTEAEALLKEYNFVDERHHGWTPLIKAAETGAISLTRLLLQHRAEVDATNKKTRTPLSFAAEHSRRGGGYLDVIKLLLQSNADPRTKDTTGKTPGCYTDSYNVKAILAWHGWHGGATAHW